MTPVVGGGRALAAAVTPLAADESFDASTVGPLVEFLASGGLDGLLALGTTGEGVLFSPEERESIAEAFVAERRPGFDVFVHCGAQSTRDTVRLAEHAASVGADGVAVIPPPYFVLDATSALEHLAAAAAACAPAPFYVYEFAARSGYAVAPDVIARLRERAPNLRGLKVSDAPFDRVAPYLTEGLDVYVGFEPLALEGMRAGAVGTVSGLATAFPELISALAHDGDRAAHRRVVELRSALEPVPFHAAMKAVVASRGVPVRPTVRSPLRRLDDRERAIVERTIAAAERAVA